MKIIQHLTQFFWLVPIVAAVLLKQINHFVGRMLFLYLIVGVIAEFFALILFWEKRNNHIVYTIADCVQFTILIFFFLYNRYVLKGVKIGLFFWGIIFYYLLATSLSLNQTSLGGLDSLLIYAMISTLSIIEINSLVNISKEGDMFHDNKFWFFSGTLVYYFSTSVLFYSYKFIKTVNSWYFMYHTIYAFFIVFISGLLFTKAMLCKPKTKIF